MRAVSLSCTLKKSGTASSTDVLLEHQRRMLTEHGVACDETVRVADLTIPPGVTSDEGDGDQWPQVRAAVVAADILVIGTPIWLGHPSSLAQRVLERLDGLLTETDEGGRTPAYGKVALVCAVGNEDGAHHVCAELWQALVDVGFSLAPGACSYWVGEALSGTDLKDLPALPAATARAAHDAARNAVHLAGLLAATPYPPLQR